MGRGPKESDRKTRTYAQDLIEIAKSAKGIEEVYVQLEMRAGKMANATEATRDRFQDQVDIAKTLLKSKKDILNTDLDTLDLATKIATAKKLGRKDDLKSLRILKARVDKRQKEKEVIQAAADKFNKKLGNIQKLVGSIPIIGNTLSDALGAAGREYEKGLGDDNMSKSQARMKSLAVGAKAVGGAIALYIGKNLLESMQSTGASLMDILARPEFIFFGAESRAIADEFGNLEETSMKLGFHMKMMALFSGVTAENQAKIMGMMAATSNSSLEALHTQMQSYKQAGVPFRAIMEDVANNTEFFAKFSKEGGSNIFDASKRAKELGINLSDVANISSSLLEFESSIEKQMEAQVLLGRNLNLDKARQLAFSGDTVELQNEILRQVGSEAEFNKMNYLQREALAGAVGLSVERLGALVRVEKAGNEEAQAKFKAFVGIGAVVLGIAGALAAVFKKSALIDMAKGGLKGVALGGAVGATAYGISRSVPQLAGGGIVNTPTLAMIGEAGKEAVVPLNNKGGMAVDMKETNQLLRALLGSSEKQVNRLGDIGTA
tara:strand:- start:106 stop:1752 length:1647 start_codon:yes stop_codon:yes gene_type:complete